MIDFEKAKEIFIKETEKYDLNNSNIKRKQLHSLRVMQNAKDIATRLNLSKNKIEIATLIGLLHDIGRFEQYTKCKTYSDQNSFDHGDFGVEVLKKDNKISEFIQDEKEWDNILVAIKNHNKYKIEEGLDEEKMLYAQIIRDADKLDIFYEACEIFWVDDIDLINESYVSEEVLKQIDMEQTVLRKKGRGFQKIDSVIELMALVYDLNYKESFEILHEKDYINKISKRFCLKDKKSMEEFEKVTNKINKYIESKI